jgi:hypothetical protein
LCEAAHLTPWYYEDELCWIAECELCATPMVVWRQHVVEPPPEMVAYLHARLREVAADHFGEIWIDDNRRSIPDHYHAHGRPLAGFWGHEFPPRPG